MLKPIFKRMPTELKEYDHWVLWREEVQKGRKKASKIPYDASTGKRASVTKRKNWTDFETAMSAYKNGGYDGVGFVLTKDDPYVGIDLDDCLINGKLALEANDIFKKLDSCVIFGKSFNDLVTIICRMIVNNK